MDHAQASGSVLSGVTTPTTDNDPGSMCSPGKVRRVLSSIHCVNLVKAWSWIARRESRGLCQFFRCEKNMMIDFGEDGAQCVLGHVTSSSAKSIMECDVWQGEARHVHCRAL